MRPIVGGLARKLCPTTAVIERSRPLIVGQEQPAAIELRRPDLPQEEGAWVLVHRHADPLVATTAPAAVLHK